MQFELFDGTLSKPFDLDDLLDTVKRYARRSYSLRG